MAGQTQGHLREPNVCNTPLRRTRLARFKPCLGKMMRGQIIHNWTSVLHTHREKSSPTLQLSGPVERRGPLAHLVSTVDHPEFIHIHTYMYRYSPALTRQS